MLSEKRSQFWETVKPMNEIINSYLQKALLKGEDVICTFRGYGCFSFFTDSRVIFVKETDNPSLADEIEFLPYRTIQRYGIVFERDGKDANVELYVPEIFLLRFYFSDCKDAFKLIEFLGRKA